MRPDTDLTLPHGIAAEVVTDDGATLSVSVHGDDSSTMPPVVLPHCWTGSRLVGVPVARRLLAAGHRVVLYDQRGHGASTVGRQPVSIARLGDDLAAVLDHLDLRDVVLAGHSMGGMTVMAYACRHTDAVRSRVRALALVATAAHGLAARGRERFWRVVLWRDLVDRVLAHPGIGRAFVRGTFGADPRRAHVEATRALFVATRSDVRRACVEAISEMDLRDALRHVDVPAVVVLGTRDTMIVNSLTRAIADHVAGATVVELPGAGHMLPFERPDEVAAAIERLAAGATPAPAPVTSPA
ncbi:MAG TPA: alpha/beta fold hydrolase [Acidimicrobiales bacterium]|nr:alpha/beta fold hydrolase [Acidimicrobiales bacterium]